MCPQISAEVSAVSTTLRLASLVRSPSNAQCSLPALMSQLSLSSTAQFVGPAGSVSLISTSLATPGPRLVTLMVNESWSPAFTWPSSGVFSSLMSGQLTVTVSEDLLSACATSELDSLSAAVEAPFGICPHCAADDVPERVTLAVAFGARSPKVQLRTLFAIEQSLLSSVQLMPFCGTLSVRVTFLAVPWPWFLTVSVYEALSPALMVLGVATFVTLRSGQFTTIVTGPVS